LFVTILCGWPRSTPSRWFYWFVRGTS